MPMKNGWDWFRCACSCHVNGTVCTEEKPCCDGICCVCNKHIVGLADHKKDHRHTKSLGEVKAPETVVAETVVPSVVREREEVAA